MTDFAAGSLPRFFPASGRSPSRNGRYAGFAAVILLHFAVLYFALSAQGPARPAPPPAPLKVNLLDEVRPPPEVLPPPPPPVALAPPPLPFIPPPEIVIQAPPATAPVRAATAVPQAAPAPTAPVVPAPATAPAPAPQVKIQPDLVTAESREPEYPSMSRRLREEGLVGLLVLVDPDGSVADVRIEQSSGHDRLDQSAVEAAKTRSRFKPGTIDGKPARMWFRYRYTFRLS
jgi:periplasmic protein TonB